MLAAYINAGSKMKFANNLLNLPKIGKLNNETLIIPQGLLIHEKNQSSKISCYCPFKIFIKYVYNVHCTYYHMYHVYLYMYVCTLHQKTKISPYFLLIFSAIRVIFFFVHFQTQPSIYLLPPQVLKSNEYFILFSHRIFKL